MARPKGGSGEGAIEQSLKGSRKDSWVIYTDCLLTRRKRYHAVYAPGGGSKFVSRIFWECVEFINERDGTSIRVEPGPKESVRAVPTLTIEMEK
jgi:hypothetical protein